MVESEQVKEGEEYLLNGSAKTMDRIDKLIRFVSDSFYDDNLTLYFKGLEDLYFQSRGYLKPGEKKKGDKDHDALLDFDIRYNDSEYYVEFDDELMPSLKRFHKWLLMVLHSNNVTMGTKPGLIGGFDRVNKRYSV